MKKIFVAFFIFCAGNSAWALGDSRIEIDSSLISLSGKYEKSESRVLIFYFASWCDHCKDEIESLHKLSKDKRNLQQRIVWISGDTAKKDALKVIKDWNLDFPLYWDSEHHFKKKFSIHKIPNAILLDEKGLVLSQEIAPDDLAGLLGRLVAK